MASLVLDVVGSRPQWLDIDLPHSPLCPFLKQRERVQCSVLLFSCVCVFEREYKSMRRCLVLCVCVCEREGERVQCSCVSVFVCVCVCVRESTVQQCVDVCVCVREREREVGVLTAVNMYTVH